jgi:hypothetical protein
VTDADRHAAPTKPLPETGSSVTVAGDGAAPGGRAKPTPEWDVTWPYGHARSAKDLGTIAAPMLAGFSFALIALILPKEADLRWAGVALSLLVAAGILFIMTVQCAVWARQWVVTPTELKEWVPNDATRRFAEQRLHAHGFDVWSARMLRAYRAAILALLAGVAVTLIPSPKTEITLTRWFAIGIAAGGWLLELTWILCNWFVKTNAIGAYNNQPDEPAEEATFLWLRRIRCLRWFARKVIPIVRVEIVTDAMVARRADELARLREDASVSDWERAEQELVASAKAAQQRKGKRVIDPRV